MLLSIITVNRNNSDGLCRTIKSILNVLTEDVECLIMDGLSTDGSVSVAKGLIAGRSNIVIRSEADTGIYDAMNKGANLACGKYIAYINSGDEVVPAAYKKYIAFIRQSNAEVLYSRTYLRSVGADELSVHERHPDEMHRDTIPHLTTAVRREYFVSAGGFDETYRISSDRDLFVRMKLAGAKFIFFDEVVSIFELGGLSSSELTKIEDLKIGRKYGFVSLFRYSRKMTKIWLSAHIRAVAVRYGLSQRRR